MLELQKPLTTSFHGILSMATIGWTSRAKSEYFILIACVCVQALKTISSSCGEGFIDPHRHVIQVSERRHGPLVRSRRTGWRTQIRGRSRSFLPVAARALWSPTRYGAGNTIIMNSDTDCAQPQPWPAAYL